jgi:hypothetical protein
MTTKTNINLNEPNEVLYRIKRGLSGYISYLAACEMNESFSEYVLYEPILRILKGHKYDVKCEVTCLGIQQRRNGDNKKLDFVATLGAITLALEVKWVRPKIRLNITSDLEKLVACQTQENWRSFLCFFGTKSAISNLKLPANLREVGKVVIAELGRTRYGCRIYELTQQNTVSIE